MRKENFLHEKKRIGKFSKMATNFINGGRVPSQIKFNQGRERDGAKYSVNLPSREQSKIPFPTNQTRERQGG